MATKSIGGAGGRDYSTLAAWASYVNALSLSANEIGECYGTTTDTTTVTVGGWTANGFSVTLRAASGQGVSAGGRAWWLTSGRAILTNSVGYAQAYVFSGTNLIVQDLQIEGTAATCSVAAQGAGGAILERSVVRLTNSASAVIKDGATSWTVRNCLIINTNGRGVQGISNGMNVYRCTVVGGGANTGIDSGTYNVILAVGCVSYNFSGDFANTAVGGSGYNATDKGSFGGTGFSSNGQVSVTSADFVSTGSGTEDYTPVTGSTKLKNLGVAISGVTLDLFGASASQGSAPDIGAVEFTEAAPAPTLTAPTATATGNTTATVGATTDASSGTLYASVSASAPSAAQIKLGQDSASAATTSGNVAVSSPGAKTIGLTSVATGSRSVWLVHNTTAGDSNVVNATWTQPTAPVLSSPTNTPGSTTALIGATTTVSSGTAYFLARVGGSAASAATIIATGQTSTVTTTTPSRTVTGLTASTANNYVDIVQVSGVTTSNVVSTAAFTTTSSGDTTPPTLTGSIVIGTVTSSSIQMSWSAGSDNVAVTSYEVSSNGGSGYVDAGNVLTYTFTGLTASTSYGLRVRAKDAAGNVSTPALAATQSTAAASGVGSISLNNAALYTFKTNNGSAIVSMPVTFFVSNVTTGALIGSAITGLSTNAQGLVTTAISNASMLAGTTYRLSYEFSSGEYGSVKLPAV